MLLRENMKGYRITPAFVLGRGREGAFSSVADAAVREVAMEGILFVAKFLSFFLSFMLHLPFHSCSKGVDPLAALRNDTPTSYGENLSISTYMTSGSFRLVLNKCMLPGGNRERQELLVPHLAAFYIILPPPHCPPLLWVLITTTTQWCATISYPKWSQTPLSPPNKTSSMHELLTIHTCLPSLLHITPSNLADGGTNKVLEWYDHLTWKWVDSLTLVAIEIYGHSVFVTML